MSRLFTGPRELAFISDITKELIKDVNGQVIYYYSVNEFKTNAHPLYGEAVEKFFDTPISLDAIVSAEYTKETKLGRFGVDKQYFTDVYMQYRDLSDKNVKPIIGDFYSFSDNFYEIVDVVVQKNIHGLPEHRQSYKISGIKAKEDQFKAKLIGPTDITRLDTGAVADNFTQQRGASVDDKRDLITSGKIEVLHDRDITDVKTLYGEE
jgi:hypothetical protein